MMVNLAERGWQPPDKHIDLPPGMTPFLHFPSQTESADYRNTWFKNMRSYWRFRFGDAVIGIHDEFAQLHIKDSDFDLFIGAYQHEMNDLAMGRMREPLIPVNPYGIQDVAKGLERLADQLNPVTSVPVGSAHQP
jgi:hypothetical protein